jgi:GT2 family glycosyltransferase
MPYIFILSWNRPIYLWVCLDSIYRHTIKPCRIVIADNNSTDSMVRDVIRGFEKRNLFYQVHFFEDNDPMRFKKLIDLYWNEISDYFVLIEGDIEILPISGGGCWLERMVSYMESNKNLGSVGSVVYKPDFISIEEAKKLEPDLTDEALNFLIKAKAPMRNYKPVDAPLFDPHNAPLRLLMLRKSAYEKIEFGRDTYIYKQLKALGYDAMISTEIIHRHLSLMNLYDYPDYSCKDRNSFFNDQKI